jgi:hypothetical protein
LAGWRLVHDLVLEHPGKVVRDEDGVEACRQGGINVRAGAVADHPGVAGLTAVVGGERKISFVVFFGENLYGGEVRGQAGALKLVGLLFGVALGDHNKAVPGSEVGEGGGHVREEFDFLVGNGLGEALDTATLFVGEGDVCELLEAGDQRAAEAAEAIAVRADGSVFDAVEVAANLLWGVNAMVEIGDETGYGTLEVDVVLPKGVVGVDEQGLVGKLT